MRNMWLDVHGFGRKAVLYWELTEFTPETVWEELTGMIRMSFLLTRNTRIECAQTAPPVRQAIAMLQRDIGTCLLPSAQTETVIQLQTAPLPPEAFRLTVQEQITLYAGDALGFVYGLLFISERFLGVKPFWFWMDQKFAPVAQVAVPLGEYASPKLAVRFRGWFFNDEVLLLQWMPGAEEEEPWRMAFEALLRCGGNMTIPGTDKNARKYAPLASSMGLWITHHHAEPLGAEMFVRAYPGRQPNYAETPELFYRLWEESVQAQKEYKVVWNVGFRGQGDCPFWSHDTSGLFDTPEKRGALISTVIAKQCDLVRRYVENPVFCTNLYGEVMELYAAGHLRLPEDCIKIGADNGYGKMVTRRRDNHCVRISSLPGQPEGRHGIYYHVSFYDLQAANHITMLPNSVSFVNAELDRVKDKQAMDYWLINCSNVRPHGYYLDAVRKKWFGEQVSDASHSKAFAQDYFAGNEQVAACFAAYPDAMVAYGEADDAHAGEQFYNENVRLLIHQWLVNKNESSRSLHWLTGDRALGEQVRLLAAFCEAGKAKLQAFHRQCVSVSAGLPLQEKQLFDATILLHATLHDSCLQGVLLFAEGFELLEQGRYLDAFLVLGDSAQHYLAANAAMRDAEYGVWDGFYANECLTDVKHTAYMLQKMMGLVREYGDNARHDAWYREAVYAPEDRSVMTLLVLSNHMTDWELYTAFRGQGQAEAAL